MKRLLRGLRARGVELDRLEAVEVFGGTGELHTKEYASCVRTLEVWEIEPRFEAALRRNLPEAQVKITDSFQEINNTSRRYDLIVVDNPLSNWGGGHCEHFDLFPEVLRLARDETILVLNVIPSMNALHRYRWPHVFNEGQLDRRRKFYEVSDPKQIALARIKRTYRVLCAKEGIDVAWAFTVRRHAAHYLALKLRRAEGTVRSE
jgi:hypothetical protein